MRVWVADFAWVGRGASRELWVSDFARIAAAKAAWKAENEWREVRVPAAQVAGGRDER